MNPFLDKNLAHARQQELLQEAEAGRKAVLARRQRRGDSSSPQQLFALAETSEEALLSEEHVYEREKNSMKVVPIISLIARLALMAALVLGLLFWILQIPLISMALDGTLLLSLRSIHLALGLLGAAGFLILAIAALFTNRTRWLGVGGIVYAGLLPIFGLTQSQILIGDLHWVVQIAHLLVGIGAMYLIRAIGRRYQYLRQDTGSTALPGKTVASTQQ